MKANSLLAGAAITAAVLVAVRSSVHRPDQHGAWIVSQDADLENPILGMFGTEAEAAAHADAVADDWPDGTVSYAHYPLGFDGGSRSAG
ncbi:hypothetical protein GCM10011374_03020 [Kocuria dechangensis]|uniref:Uncharacterized protein n=1 Tax=Kocuria dechangensis TaxID=1176249 RepID=A0A917GFV0_9MICC|nr:hypothetical protein [Kocuria dechangensis]GGG44055.1 hypothetical protein GCM10011374_03020 [Kocuria dechangensis]